MTPHPRLVAIGGGGFTHEADVAMEDFILTQVPVARPRIGIIGTASRNDPIKVARFRARFADVCAMHSHLPMGADAAHAQAWAKSLDIVYVGGGNTLHLLTEWHSSGIGQVMVAAARRGVLMAGVSAGASVWFDHALSDSGGRGLEPFRRIGLVAGSCCPHYSSEPQSQAAFMAHIARGELPDGIAIDDGVAVMIDGTGVMRSFSTREGAGAYNVRRTGNTAVCMPMAQAITP